MAWRDPHYAMARPHAENPQSRNWPLRVPVSDAGYSETSHKQTTGTLFLDACGPDSIQELHDNMRVHQLRLCRVWFTLPTGAVAALPPDNTLYLLLKREGRDTVIGTSDFHFATTSLCYDHTTAPPTSTAGDPGQHVESINRFIMAAIPIIDRVDGDVVLYENKCRTIHNFSGETNGVTSIRVQVVDSTGAPFTALNDARIFIEAFVTFEPTI